MEGLNLFKEYGFAGITFGTIATLLFIIIKWTLATTKEILHQAKEERKEWRITIDKINATITKHDEKADERAKYIREEHRQMIETLGRINGYRK